MPATTDHEAFRQPSDDAIPLWRYMDLSKYLRLLQTKSIWFSRADLLGDPFEGASPDILHAEVEAFVAVAKNIGNMRESLSAMNRSVVKSNYISCWHSNHHESAAMWGLYSASNDSISIKTSYRTLKELLPEKAFLGVVGYIDYKTESFGSGMIYNRIMHKRRSFEHEREVRAIITKWSDIVTLDDEGAKGEAASIGPWVADGGLAVPADLNSLVEAVYVNPLAQSWLLDVVEGATRSYGLSVPVIKSSMAGEALF